MKNKSISIEVGEQSFLISIAEGEMVNLNQLHVASGKNENQSPRFWLRNKLTTQLIEKLKESLNVSENHIIKTNRGKGGGTYAHWQIALAYAKYLSPEIHLQVNQVFKERLEELIDPELGLKRSKQRAIDSWKRQGRNTTWINERIDGINKRNYFTDILQSHGTKGIEFAEISDIENKAILGCTAKQYKEKKGLAKTGRVRDNISTTDLAAFSLLESVASEKIDNENACTGKECAGVVTRVSEKMSKLYKDLLSC